MANGDRHTLSEQQLEAIIERGARRAIKGALVHLGIDAENPLEAQKDFQALREWRVAMQAVRSKGLLTTVAVLVSGLLVGLGMGIRSYFITGAG